MVEILSPEKAAKDMNQKWWLYESFGVPEYLIIDPESRTARLLRLEGDHYRDAARASWGESLALLAGRITVDIG